ncbi:hypothetical protein [Floccifex sp.]|uniref:hypothetical protein n=1 Tax=Floccifex sp. TaxID=2815810 RepID=UPI003F1164ED
MKITIQAKLSEFPIEQVLYYLGYQDQELDSLVLNQIHEMRNLTISSANPKLLYRIFSKEECRALHFEGNDIRQIIEPSQYIVFMVATLSNSVEKIAHQKSVTNVSEALIFDACCNAAIENVCDNFQVELTKQLEKERLYLSDRFSPGYGDFPLSFQSTLCSCLNTSSKIAVNVSENNILSPLKTVSAICGISDKPFKHRFRGCETCNLFITCSLRKRGKKCDS